MTGFKAASSILKELPVCSQVTGKESCVHRLSRGNSGGLQGGPPLHPLRPSSNQRSLILHKKIIVSSLQNIMYVKTKPSAATAEIQSWAGTQRRLVWPRWRFRSQRMTLSEEDDGNVQLVLDSSTCSVCLWFNLRHQTYPPTSKEHQILQGQIEGDGLHHLRQWWLSCSSNPALHAGQSGVSTLSEQNHQPFCQHAHAKCETVNINFTLTWGQLTVSPQSVSLNWF